MQRSTSLILGDCSMTTNHDFLPADQLMEGLSQPFAPASGLHADADLDSENAYRAIGGFRHLLSIAGLHDVLLTGDRGLENPAAAKVDEVTARIDQLVSDYLLRDFNGSKLQKELSSALPASGSFTLGEGQKELRQRLEEALKNGELPTDVAKLVKKLVADGTLSADEVTKLKDSLSKSDADRRRACLAELERLTNESEAVNAGYTPMLEKLKEVDKGHSLPDTAAKLNELRTQFIVKDLGPESKPEDFKRVAERLEKEAKAGNKQAEDWRLWALVNEQVARLSQCDKLTDASAIIKEIGRLGKEGKNPYARTALASVLAGTADSAARNNWLSTYREVNGKPVFVPNFSKITAESPPVSLPPVSLTIAKQAAVELRQTPVAEGERPKSDDIRAGRHFESTGASNRAEISAISIAISAAPGDLDLAKELTTTLERVIPGKLEPLQEAVKGMFDAIRWQVPGAEKLVAAFLNACYSYSAWQKPPLPATVAFRSMLPELEKLALEQNKAALLVMAAVATGYADKDPALNPKGRSPAHERARLILEEVGQRPGQRATVVALR
jgi:hypothetical protein